METGLIQARILTTYSSGSTGQTGLLLTQAELTGLLEWVRDNTQGVARAEAEWLRVHGPQPDSHSI